MLKPINVMGNVEERCNATHHRSVLNLVGVFEPMLLSVFVCAGKLGTSANTLSQATAYLILTIGLSLLITNPIAKVLEDDLSSSLPIPLCLHAVSRGHTRITIVLSTSVEFVSGFGKAPYEVLV